MKKILFLSFAAMLAVGATKAQSADTTATRAHKTWHNRQHYNKGNRSDTAFYQKLNLTADQQSKLSAIKADQKTKAAAIRNNSSLTADQKRQQLRDLNKSTYEQREAVYTPEQKELIKEDHEQHRAQHHHYHKQAASSANDSSSN